MADFVPLQPPSSAGVQMTIDKEQNRSTDLSGGNEDPNNPVASDNMMRQLNTGEFLRADDDGTDVHNSPYVGQLSMQMNDKRVLQNGGPPGRIQQPFMFQTPSLPPDSNKVSSPSSNLPYSAFSPSAPPDSIMSQWNMGSSDHPSSNGNDPLITKLNFIISLLEEQQDERTNSMYEEIILYFFLGVFIIFVLDSFVKVGRYVR